MRRLTALCALLFAFSSTLPASEFDWLVREFARESGAHPVHMPLFGLVRLAVAVGHPAGTSELRLAVFERPQFIGDDFGRLADRTVGSAWNPIVRTRSRDGEATNIYVQPDGPRLRLLVATIDNDSAVFVQVRIRKEELIRFVDKQEHRHHAW